MERELQNKKILKELPYTPNRGDVYTMFYKIDKRTVKDEVNTVMCEHRGLPKEIVRFKKRLLHPEWIRVLKYLGIPEGYKKPEWLRD